MVPSVCKRFERIWWPLRGLFLIFLIIFIIFQTYSIKNRKFKLFSKIFYTKVIFKRPVIFYILTKLLFLLFWRKKILCTGRKHWSKNKTEMEKCSLISFSFFFLKSKFKFNTEKQSKPKKPTNSTKRSKFRMKIYYKTSHLSSLYK